MTKERKLTKQEEKRKAKYPNSAFFTWCNENPKGKLTTDCSIRALTTVLGKPYVEVYTDLFNLSLKTGEHIGNRKNIEKYLKEQGFVRCVQPKFEDNTKVNLKTFVAALYSKGSVSTAFISVGAHHVTAYKDGTVHDIWDCTEEKVGVYYIRQGEHFWYNFTRS